MDALVGGSRESFCHVTNIINHGTEYTLNHLNSVLEMQTMLATLLENFEFALPDNADEMKILRMPTGMMVPMVDGQPRLGAWMGLKVTNVAQ